MGEHEPQTRRAKKIREQVSDERWERLVADALRRVEVLDLGVAEGKDNGRSWRKSVEATARASWPTNSPKSVVSDDVTSEAHT